jgi:hypothetical protein
MDDFIFQLLSYVGALTSFLCAAYLLRSSKQIHDKIARTNLILLGIVNLLAGILFVLAIFQVQSFAVANQFAKFMRPLIILMEILPAFITYRMRYE